MQVEQSVVDGATVARVLADAAASDILVIGGRRSGQFWAAITGRIAERLVAHVTVPVVVVPEHWTPGEQAPVVMGVDGRTATAALTFAADRAERRGADLVLIRAWEPPTSISPFGRVYLARDSGHWEHESQLELDAAIRAVSAAHPDLRMRGELHQGTPADVLLRGEGTASMLVIGRRHRTALGAFLTGSVGEKLLHRGRSPVCVVPPVDHG
ncbi:nucleotide-binding universal stress UspA family protein [Curtobacterium sp. PhB115]|nr:nucleotide-binding universal stress UspA family protein [Curtobacterium sp. PhB115]